MQGPQYVYLPETESFKLRGMRCSPEKMTVATDGRTDGLTDIWTDVDGASELRKYVAQQRRLGRR